MDHRFLSEETILLRSVKEGYQQAAALLVGGLLGVEVADTPASDGWLTHKYMYFEYLSFYPNGQDPHHHRPLHMLSIYAPKIPLRVQKF